MDGFGGLQHAVLGYPLCCLLGGAPRCWPPTSRECGARAPRPLPAELQAVWDGPHLPRVLPLEWVVLSVAPTELPQRS